MVLTVRFIDFENPPAKISRGESRDAGCGALTQAGFTSTLSLADKHEFE